MQSLIHHLYTCHISSTDPNSLHLSKQQPLKIYNLTQQQLQFYNTMLVRGMFVYSAAMMELRLGVKGLLGLLRLGEFGRILGVQGYGGVFQDWVQGELMPVAFTGAKLPNSPFIYVDHKQPKQHTTTPEPQPKKHPKSKSKPKQSPNSSQPNPTHPPTNPKTMLMINMLQLTLQLQNEVLLQQLSSKGLQLNNPHRRLEAIEKFKEIKIQEYVAERYGVQALMVFNFVRKYPFADQKFLLGKTMLSATDLRKALAQLISQGLVSYYPENSRSVLFKALDKQRVSQKYVDHIAQTMLNILIFLQNQQIPSDKKHLLLKSLSTLDRILMIFMA